MGQTRLAVRLLAGAGDAAGVASVGARFEREGFPELAQPAAPGPRVTGAGRITAFHWIGFVGVRSRDRDGCTLRTNGAALAPRSADLFQHLERKLAAHRLTQCRRRAAARPRACRALQLP